MIAGMRTKFEKFSVENLEIEAKPRDPKGAEPVGEASIPPCAIYKKTPSMDGFATKES